MPRKMIDNFEPAPKIGKGEQSEGDIKPETHEWPQLPDVMECMGRRQPNNPAVTMLSELEEESSVEICHPDEPQTSGFNGLVPSHLVNVSRTPRTSFFCRKKAPTPFEMTKKTRAQVCHLIVRSKGDAITEIRQFMMRSGKLSACEGKNERFIRKLYFPRRFRKYERDSDDKVQPKKNKGKSLFAEPDKSKPKQFGLHEMVRNSDEPRAIVVTGQPGIGKTYELQNLKHTLNKPLRLDSDQANIRSIKLDASLLFDSRTDINALISELRSEAGRQKADKMVLIIDSLDRHMYGGNAKIAANYIQKLVREGFFVVSACRRDQTQMLLEQSRFAGGRRGKPPFTVIEPTELAPGEIVSLLKQYIKHYNPDISFDKDDEELIRKKAHDMKESLSIPYNLRYMAQMAGEKGLLRRINADNMLRQYYLFKVSRVSEDFFEKSSFSTISDPKKVTFLQHREYFLHYIALKLIETTDGEFREDDLEINTGKMAQKSMYKLLLQDYVSSGILVKKAEKYKFAQQDFQEYVTTMAVLHQTVKTEGGKTSSELVKVICREGLMDKPRVKLLMSIIKKSGNQVRKEVAKAIVASRNPVLLFNLYCTYRELNPERQSGIDQVIESWTELAKAIPAFGVIFDGSFSAIEEAAFAKPKKCEMGFLSPKDYKLSLEEQLSMVQNSIPLASPKEKERMIQWFIEMAKDLPNEERALAVMKLCQAMYLHEIMPFQEQQRSVNFWELRHNDKRNSEFFTKMKPAIIELLTATGVLKPVPEYHWIVDREPEEYNRRYGLDIMTFLRELNPNGEERQFFEFGPGSGRFASALHKKEMGYEVASMCDKIYYQPNSVIERLVDYDNMQSLEVIKGDPQRKQELERMVSANPIVQHDFQESLKDLSKGMDRNVWRYLKTYFGDEAARDYSYLIRDLLKYQKIKKALVAYLHPLLIGDLDYLQRFQLEDNRTENFVYDDKNKALMEKYPEAIPHILFGKLAAIHSDKLNLRHMPTPIGMAEEDGTAYPIAIPIRDSDHEELKPILEELAANPDLLDSDVASKIDIFFTGVMAGDFSNVGQISDNQIDFALACRSTVYKEGDEYVDLVIETLKKMKENSVYIDDAMRENCGKGYRVKEINQIQKRMHEMGIEADIKIIVGPRPHKEDPLLVAPIGFVILKHNNLYDLLDARIALKKATIEYRGQPESEKFEFMSLGQMNNDPRFESWKNPVREEGEANNHTR